MPKRTLSHIDMSFKICVSGAAAGECTRSAKEYALAVGRAIARAGAVLLTGATTGIPELAARGAKEAGGVVIGFSPAATRKEHLKKYRLPLENMDVVVYTGFHYAGRNLLLTRASDAVVVVCGRIGTLNEFTIAFEDKKLIGVLKGSGGITDEIPDILEIARRKGSIIYDGDPRHLIERLVAELRHERKNHVLREADEVA